MTKSRPRRQSFRHRAPRKAERRTRFEVRTGVGKIFVHEISVEARKQLGSQFVVIAPPLVTRIVVRQIAIRNAARTQPFDHPLGNIDPTRILDPDGQMQRGLVHGHREVIAAPGNVEKVTGQQGFDQATRLVVESNVLLSSVRSTSSIARTVKEPSLSTIELKDEDFLLVAVQIETVNRAPCGVDVDLRAAAKERLE